VLSLGRTDTFVPIDTEAVRQEDIAQASAWAQEHRFDAILSTDGDADRPLIGDENGSWMRGDVVGILCAQYLQANVVVTPVSSNTAVEKCASFSSVLRTKIGSPYVIAGMQAAAPGAVVVGYEANGGFLLGSDISNARGVLAALPTRDAVLPMLALLTLASERACPLSQLAGSLPGRFTASDRIAQVPTQASGALIDTLRQDARQAAALMAPDAGAVLAQDTTDGLRLTFGNGDVVHLRPSGNAPELRCYAEADSQARAQDLCNACLARVAEAIQAA
jgi:phosphomannomutase